MDPQPIVRIAGIGLNVADVARATAFYRVLGFTTVAPGRMAFGGFALDLTLATGASYPARRAANDPWFQHFAVAVADMPAAAARILAAGATPISVGGPQLLPANTGGVTAFKIRDPDGHPLELSMIPGSDWRRDALPGEVFCGVDHTAIAVADLARSEAWYAARGLREIGRSLNAGPEQDRLDGLTGVAVGIVALAPAVGGPHLELLAYRSPLPAHGLAVGDGDIAGTRTLIGGGMSEIDPDGHRLALTDRAPSPY